MTLGAFSDNQQSNNNTVSSVSRDYYTNSTDGDVTEDDRSMFETTKRQQSNNNMVSSVYRDSYTDDVTEIDWSKVETAAYTSEGNAGKETTKSNSKNDRFLNMKTTTTTAALADCATTVNTMSDGGIFGNRCATASKENASTVYPAKPGRPNKGTPHDMLI